MPEKQTVQRARRAKAEGKKPTTQASEFVREEMHHIREGKHGAQSRQQAVAIGLSKARRAGVDLPEPGQSKAKRKTAARKRTSTGTKRATAKTARGGTKQRKSTGTAGKRSTATRKRSTASKRSTTSTRSKTGAKGRGRTTSRTSTSRKSRSRS